MRRRLTFTFTFYRGKPNSPGNSVRPRPRLTVWGWNCPNWKMQEEISNSNYQLLPIKSDKFLATSDKWRQPSGWLKDFWHKTYKQHWQHLIITFYAINAWFENMQLSILVFLTSWFLDIPATILGFAKLTLVICFLSTFADISGVPPQITKACKPHGTFLTLKYFILAKVSHVLIQSTFTDELWTAFITSVSCIGFLLLDFA